MRRDTRSALLDVAQERFAIDGFAGTSVRDLATAVGIKESSVYNHFASKQAVLDALLARIDERLVAVARRFVIKHKANVALVRLQQHFMAQAVYLRHEYERHCRERR